MERLKISAASDWVLAMLRAIMLACLCMRADAANSPHLYVTWEGVEVDKGASIWFIKRHVDRDAVFSLLPQGTMIDSGIPFDVPQGRYRRVHNASTLELLLRDYPSTDEVIKKLALITHDVEINLWRPRVFPESQILEYRLKEVDHHNGANGISAECFISFFDAVYAWLKSGRTDAASLATPGECMQSRPDSENH